MLCECLTNYFPSMNLTLYVARGIKNSCLVCAEVFTYIPPVNLLRSYMRTYYLASLRLNIVGMNWNWNVERFISP